MGTFLSPIFGIPEFLRRRADSTMSGYNSSIVYLNKLLSEYSFPPFEDLMPLHVEGEHMENMIETAGRWFANTTFRTHMNTWLSASSKETHFKAMKQVLYLKFKDHDLFKGDQSWWTDLLK
jgi:hypothetical protein